VRTISRGAWLAAALTLLALSSCSAPGAGAARPAPLREARCELGDSVGAPGDPPGIVVAHRPAASGQYLGSPSLLAASDGTLYVSHDVFGPRRPEPRQTHVYASQDGGRSWVARAVVEGQFWSSLFEHQSALYLLGTETGLGAVVIRRSRDGGATWTDPASEETGRLLREGRHHTAPMPLVLHEGRLWASFEELLPPFAWPRSLSPYLLSVDADADLLDATAWQRSVAISFPDEGPGEGWLETQPVITPGGGVRLLSRVDVRGEHERMAVLGWDGERLQVLGFPRFAGGSKKFTVRWDPSTRRYWTLVNEVEEEPVRLPAAVRNRLTLVSSRDLESWSSHAVLLSHEDVDHTGFQYADLALVGEDLVFVSRTAYPEVSGPANDYHNSNYITFHRLARYAECAARAR